MGVVNQLLLKRALVITLVNCSIASHPEAYRISFMVRDSASVDAPRTASLSSPFVWRMSSVGKRKSQRLSSAKVKSASHEQTPDVTLSKRVKRPATTLIKTSPSVVTDIESTSERVGIEEHTEVMERSSLADTLVGVSRRLHDRLKDRIWRGTSKQPVVCSYNVLEYASETLEAYTRRYGARSTGRALLVGMNPGPWGMVQTGVPFGEVSYVRDWLKVEGEVRRPSREHPKRPVEGFQCQRSEVSGARLWGFFKRIFGTADAWGDRMFVYNYCPLTFMSSSGANITPDRLSPREREALDEACGQALVEVISALQPCVIVGLGTFAGSKCAQALEFVEFPSSGGVARPEVVVVNHPSPASPSGVKWTKARGMNELVLSSSTSKEVDRFIS